MGHIPIKILFLADTHLGFDYPFRPRVQRRRRGDDFFENYRQALLPALQGQVDAVVHGGDLLYRSKVPAQLVEMALAPLRQVAQQGIPVFVVPGNHERSQIPFQLLAQHPLLHIFDRPRLFQVVLAGRPVVLAGFPYCRDRVRLQFTDLLEQTGWFGSDCPRKLLCLHHAVEGATVGPQNFVFRRGDDVIRARDLPHDCSAVLSGHIHRQQNLYRDLAARPLPAPVFYPGSIERTSFAEQREAKGYLTLHIDAANSVRPVFHQLYARPMVQQQFDMGHNREQDLLEMVATTIAQAPDDAVLTIRIKGEVPPAQLAKLKAQAIRLLAPATMNISLQLPR